LGKGKKGEGYQNAADSGSHKRIFGKSRMFLTQGTNEKACKKDKISLHDKFNQNILSGDETCGVPNRLLRYLGINPFSMKKIPRHQNPVI